MRHINPQPVTTSTTALSKISSSTLSKVTTSVLSKVTSSTLSKVTSSTLSKVTTSALSKISTTSLSKASTTALSQVSTALNMVSVAALNKVSTAALANLLPTVLIPLYIYPTDTSYWAALPSAAAAYPNVQFHAIINIDSGPGGSTYPDSNYIAAIATLTSYSNIKPLCYVHTTYAAEPLSTLEANITKCANWASYTGADIHMSGIFFDEAPIDYTASGEYMSNAASFARNTMGTGQDTLVFNTGGPNSPALDPRWYNLTDYLIVFEDNYAAFQATPANLDNIPAADASKASMLIHGFTGGAANLSTLVTTLRTKGLGSLYITTRTLTDTSPPSWGAWGGFSSLWTQLVQDMAA